MRLLDLFCGAGGAAMGYHAAGFTEIVGIDINPQPNYPFKFIQADVTTPDFEFDFNAWDFDVIHASPPCQFYSRLQKGSGHADLVGWTRDWILRQSDGDGTTLPYVIENVPGSPLISPVQLCGTAFGCVWSGPEGTFEMHRHRIFETPFFLMSPPCSHQHPVLGIYGDLSKNIRMNNAGRRQNGDRKAGIFQAETLMGINWMTPKELVQSIPPVYTEWIGRQLLNHIYADSMEEAREQK